MLESKILKVKTPYKKWENGTYLNLAKFILPRKIKKCWICHNVHFQTLKFRVLWALSILIVIVWHSFLACQRPSDGCNKAFCFASGLLFHGFRCSYGRTVIGRTRRATLDSFCSENTKNHKKKIKSINYWTEHMWNWKR